MIKIPLLFPDFRQFVRSKAYNSATNTHPVFYWEDKEQTEIYFYKPEEYILYYIHILKSDKLPEGFNIRGLKLEFNAIEIHEQLVKPKIAYTTFS